jgi:NADPH:quinone reductase-like Zn-dependent oxidoreductase
MMMAVRIHRFGPPNVLVVEDVPTPEAGPGQIVVQVKSAGIAPQDALIRSGKSAVPQPLPLILGGEISGVVVATGVGVTEMTIGQEVFGTTHERFTGGYAQYAAVQSGTIAPKPQSLNHTHAASVPVAATSAWQMVFECVRPLPGQTMLIHGGDGDVGGYAVQFAKRAGALVIATATAENAAYVRELGADGVVDFRATRFYERLKEIDAVIDTIGGEMVNQSYRVLKHGGILVSSAAGLAMENMDNPGVRTISFALQVTADRLRIIAGLIDSGEVKTQVGEVLWLNEVRQGHEMLEGLPHRRGKIVIKVAD